MAYQTNELTFELPQGLKDKSMNIFTLHDDGPSEFSMVISRVPLHEGQTLADYTALQVQEMQKKMPAFSLLAQSQRQVAGEPAAFVEFVWRAEAGIMHQRQVSFAPPGRGLVVLITGTCKNRFSPEWEQAFQSVINSMKLQEPVTV
jgi:hypothetical protein